MHEPRTDGEAWTREQLTLLRADRYAPPAILRLLSSSQRRAVDARAARPELTRQARRWTAAGALGHAALPGRGPAGRRLVWWAIVTLMLDWHLGMVESEDGRPCALGPADAATLARAWLVPLAAHDPSPALLAAAYATDVLDGMLARASAPTRLGRDLEGLVDACLSVAALHGLRRTGRLGGAVMTAEAVRLAIGTAFHSAWYLARAQAPPARLSGAGRRSAPIRALGLLAAATGRRRLGESLLASGGAIGILVAVRQRARPTRAG